METTHLEDGGNTGTTGITTMNAEASTVSATLAKAINLAKFWRKSASTSPYQDIIEFLKRPIIVQSGVLQSTDTINTFTSVNCPNAIVSDNMIKRKLEGIFAMRATMVFTLQVNANRFQQGRYILAFIRQFGAANLTGALNPVQTVIMGEYVNGHIATLTQVTQLPHVELDVNCDTTATLKIPYISGIDYWNVAYNYNLQNIAGQLKLIPYSALQSGPNAINTAGYTIWAHLEDVELEGTAYQQMGTMSEQEQDKSNIGPVTRVSSTISDIASSLSNIPSLSAYATPVAWASGKFANIAMMMGWSKPTMLERIQRVQSNSLAYAHNVDNTDNSVVAGFYSSNEVEQMPGFSGTDIDEMSIDFLKSIPSYIATYSWAKTDIAGTTIATFEVGPAIGLRTVNFGGVDLTVATPMGLLSKLFSYWRGSITFKIKLVKTEFHSGRLAVYFQPADEYSLAPYVPTLTESRYLHRDIIDIRKSNMIELTIPYTSLLPYRLCEGTYETTGTFVVKVLEPLVSPDSVTSNISLLVEVAGGPDLEFQAPKMRDVVPVLGVTPQSGSFEQDECATITKTLGKMELQEYTNAPARVCMGESIRSIRALLKSNVFYNGVLNTTSNSYRIYPFDILYGRVSSGTLSLPFQSDLYSLFGTIYGLTRGSVRVKAVMDDYSKDGNKLTRPNIWFAKYSNSVATNVDVNADNSFVYANSLAQTYMSSPMSSAIVDTTMNLAAEFQFPHYCLTNSRISGNHMQAPVNTTSLNWTMVPRNYTICDLSFFPHYTGGVSRVGFARTVGDDFNAGGFISIPPLHFSS